MSTSQLMRPVASTTVTSTASSQSLDLPGNLLDPSFVPTPTNPTVMLTNVGGAEVFVELGPPGTLASAPGADGVPHSTPITPGTVMAFSLNLNDSTIAHVCSAGQTTTLRVTTAKEGF